MKISTDSAFASTVASNAIASKTINAAEGSSNSSEGILNTHFPRALSVQDALAQSFVMRRIAPAMARVEVRTTKMACKAAERALAATGRVLVRVGAACSDAGQRALARQQSAITENQN